MPISIHRTEAPVGALVSGFAMEGLSRGDTAELYQAFLEYGVLVFKGLNLDDAGQLALARLFGQPELHPNTHFQLPHEPLLIELSAKFEASDPNHNPDPDAIVGAIGWHVDGSYTEYPNRGIVLRALVVPEVGGDTGWIDLAGVYAGLPHETKCRLQGLQIVHSYSHTGRKDQASLPDVAQPLVYAHPETDRPLLNISPTMAHRIAGLPREEGDELLTSLISTLTDKRRAYRHQWEAGDVVVWDNWRAMHRAYGHPQKYPRVMRRTSLKSPMRLGRWI